MLEDGEQELRVEEAAEAVRRVAEEEVLQGVEVEAADVVEEAVDVVEDESLKEEDSGARIIDESLCKNPFILFKFAFLVLGNFLL